MRQPALARPPWRAGWHPQPTRPGFRRQSLAPLHRQPGVRGNQGAEAIVGVGSGSSLEGSGSGAYPVAARIARLIARSEFPSGTRPTGPDAAGWRRLGRRYRSCDASLSQSFQASRSAPAWCGHRARRRYSPSGASRPAHYAARSRGHCALGPGRSIFGPPQNNREGGRLRWAPGRIGWANSRYEGQVPDHATGSQDRDRHPDPDRPVGTRVLRPAMDRAVVGGRRGDDRAGEAAQHTKCPSGPSLKGKLLAAHVSCSKAQRVSLGYFTHTQARPACRPARVGSWRCDGRWDGKAFHIKCRRPLPGSGTRHSKFVGVAG